MRLRDDALYCPPLPLLWGYRGGPDTPARRVHAMYASEMWRAQSLSGKACLLLRFATWPVIVPLVAIYFTTINGRAIKQRTGRGVLAQFTDQLALAARHGVLPPWYYMFELHRAENRAVAAEYLHRFETKANLYRLIKRYVERNDGLELNDKLVFARVCSRAGLPVPEIVAQVHDGQFENIKGEPFEKDAFVLPEADLFAKPAKGKGGRGTAMAHYLGEGRYEFSDGSTLTGPELIEAFAALSREQPILVQKRLFNHPDMLDLCANALCCVRIMTCRNETGGYEMTNAVLRMAQRMDSTVDGLHRGGIAARVDVDTGELGFGTDLGFKPGVGWVERNPRNGALIAGRVLPEWPATRDLVLRAHAAFSYKFAVGWDVAITPDGPVIVEGNGAPCVDILQRVDCEPLGQKRFGELLAFHCAKAVADYDRERAGPGREALQSRKA